MPVFAVSQSYGRAIGAAAGVRVVELTHQHGHIGAAMIGCEPEDGVFLAMHVSGGTTELLLVEKSGGIIEKIEKLGGTTDIAAGQLVDRIGVSMGLAFPAGQAMEEIAEKGDVSLKVSCRDREASFSGAETAARRLLEKGAPKPYVAYAIEECIAKTLIRLADSAVKQYGKRELLLCGGVMRNSHICRMVCEQTGTRVIPAGKEYSSDNACGIAAQARLIDRRKEVRGNDDE